MGPKQDSEGKNWIILTLTYKAYSKPVKDIVENNFQILKFDFQEKLHFSYRRTKNIKDMLITISNFSKYNWCNHALW